MDVDLIAVPYDSGHHGRRMGAGPGRILSGGLPAALEARDHSLRITELRVDFDFPTEVGVALETQRLVARAVRNALGEGRMPLVLAGNCATALGTVAALGPERTGVIWFDSHGDFNTPETSRSGFFDGMVLSMMVGDCWREAAATVPGFAPLDERNAVLVGVRDLDPAEEERLRSSEVRRVGVEAVRRGGEAAIGAIADELASRIDQVYVHVDLDVLDPSVAPINEFQAENGPSLEQVVDVIETVARRLPVAAAALTAYDPECDPEGAACAAAARLAAALTA